MQTLDDLDEPRQQLMRRAFGKLLDWKVPAITETVGPFDPEVFSRFNDRLSSKVEKARTLLKAYDDNLVAALVADKYDEADERADEWREFVRSELAAVKRSRPPWYAGGFGHPGYAAEFDYWCKMPHYSIIETLSLSVGVDPKHVEKDWLNDLRREDSPDFWATLRFLLLREEQLKRRFDPADNGWKVRPPEFLDWCRKVDFEAHPEFVRLLEKYHPSGPEPAGTEDGPRRTDPREVDSIAQLFTAMAIEYYGYVPSQSRSPVPTEIVELAAELGLNISDDTVRKYLKLGASFLPEDWKPKID